MVKAAYSSGKPALGVGAGNVQCIIDRDVDIKEAVPKIIAGRIFDNGIICSGEQSVIVAEEMFDKIMDEFKNNKGFIVRDKVQKEAFRNAMFVNKSMNKDAVGQSVHTIAKIAGVEIPEDTKIIVIEADGPGEKDIIAKEKCVQLYLHTSIKVLKKV